MRALKALVIIMGILLLGGSATLAVLLVQRLGTHHAPAGLAASPLPSVVELGLPHEAEVTAMAALGDRLALHVKAPDGDRILVIDPARGTILETIQLKPAPQ
jgi:hypothetical protein